MTVEEHIIEIITWAWENGIDIRELYNIRAYYDQYFRSDESKNLTIAWIFVISWLDLNIIRHNGWLLWDWNEEFAKDFIDGATQRYYENKMLEVECSYE